MSGIICGNFGNSRTSLEVCKGAWHAGCYVQAATDHFPVLGVSDLDHALLNEADLEEDDPLRFREARSGDHLMVPFQCDCCHFFNMQGRSARPNCPVDSLLMKCIRRANLDSMWSRERSTVRNNLLNGRKLNRIQEVLGLTWVSHQGTGPFPSTDLWGMNVAVALLMRSLDPGKNAKQVQFGTIRQLRSFVSNKAHASADGVGATFMGDAGTGARVTHSVTNSFWFNRFMQGCHRRMGDVWLPDKAVSRYVMRASFELLEEAWAELGHDEYYLLRLSKTACILIAGYFAALRGEEIGKASLDGILEYWRESMQHPIHPYVPFTLVGRFKGVDGLKLFVQPLAAVTEDQFQIGLWFRRYLSLLRKRGISTGPLFANQKGKPMSISELDVDFHRILMEVQRTRASVIPDHVKIEEVYSTYRSLRRGATSEAQNVNMSDTVINANNRWRKQMRSKGMKPGMSMMEHYTDANVAAPTLLQFSALLPT